MTIKVGCNYAIKDGAPQELIGKAIDSVEDGLGGDYGAALVVCAMYRGRILYDHATRKWCAFVGPAWVTDETDSVKTLILEHVANVYAEAAAKTAIELQDEDEESDKAEGLKGRLDRLNKECLKLREVRKANTVLQAVWGMSGMSVRGNEWDKDPWLLCVLNGVVDLRKDAPVRFREGKPEDYLRRQARVTYNPKADCPRWKQFIREVQEDKPDVDDIVDWLQRYYGYVSTGLTTEHVFFNMVGDNGRNGKGVTVRTLFKVLGDYAGPVAREVLLKSKRGKTSGQADEDLYNLMGKRYVVWAEMSDGDALDTGIVKSLTGADPFTARPIHGHQVTIVPTFKIAGQTNSLPHASAIDTAYWTRFAALSYDLRFLPSSEVTEPNHRPVDINLENALETELSGILNWLIEGAIAWQDRPLLGSIPKSMQLAAKEYRANEDIFGQWLNDSQEVVRGAGMLMRAKDALTRHNQWRDERGHQSKLNYVTFGKAMQKAGFASIMRGGVTYYEGLGLVDQNGYAPKQDMAHLMVNALQAANAGDAGKAMELARSIADKDIRETVIKSVETILHAQGLVVQHAMTVGYDTPTAWLQ